MKKLLNYCLIILGIIGCSTAGPPKSPSELESVVFIDTNVFDKNMVDSMSAKTDTINVTPVGLLSINQMPERLSKWLGAISDKNGQVDIEPKVTGAKSFTFLLGLLPFAYDYLKSETSYGLAGDYNATIFYQLDTGIIKKIEFVRK
ncbi:MAG: hypothetical protein BWK79_13695 [Beggiatoa sp. IS2]|nr:MAG: hypothetical protein BWK79_13695 [Beggiatoa sp. IS2]